MVGRVKNADIRITFSDIKLTLTKRRLTGIIFLTCEAEIILKLVSWGFYGHKRN